MAAPMTYTRMLLLFRNIGAKPAVTGAFCWKSVPELAPRQQVRHASRKFNTRRPYMPMHIWKHKVLEFTKYKKIKDTRPLAEKCELIQVRQQQIEDSKPHPMDVYYSEEVRRIFQNNPVIAVFHENSPSVEETKNLRRRVRRIGMDAEYFSHEALDLALAGSQFENIRPLLAGPHVLVYSKERRIKELIQTTKRLTSFMLLGGLVYDRLMTWKDLDVYSQLPTIDVLQAMTAALLNTAVSQTHTLLQSNQSQLVRNLQQWNTQREG